MKRLGNCFEKIAELENLQLAFFKAQRGKAAKKEVIKFRANLLTNLLELRNGLLEGNIEVGKYNRFNVYEPKKREICTVPFRERVLHHAIINICEQRLESFQIDQSYACRKGKGIDAALRKALELCSRFSWYLKLDIHKYFDSVDHLILHRIRSRLFKDERLLELLWRITDSYHTAPGVGLPIGNLTSQYDANTNLTPNDHYIKEVLGIGGFVRYMDDFLMFANSKDELRWALEKDTSFLTDKLHLTLNPPQINRTRCGVTFLGYRIYPDNIKLSQRSKKRYRKKIALASDSLESGEWTQCEYVRHVEPLLAFVQRANSKGFLGAVSTA